MGPGTRVSDESTIRLQASTSSLRKVILVEAAGLITVPSKNVLTFRARSLLRRKLLLHIDNTT
jgi:hypothetical protein